MTELLAPAGNIESLKVAVENGADAVYLGVSEFNARLKADNFTVDNLAEWVEYAHLFGVKVYLVLNTSLKEAELSRAADVAKKAKTAKIDAIIVTDIGLIQILQNTMPDMVLHFSTQTGIHNLEGALEAKKLGASRVIVSRETTARDIENIKQTGLQVEAFVHGALCVSFSGGCLLSSFIGGNSGNRGLCMQPCRQQYKALTGSKNAKEGYLLSTSDLCALPYVEWLIKSGVSSLKIEGRLRRPEYVAQAVKTYRKILDGGKYSEEDIVNLKKIYNRGDFTEGYYFSADDKNRTANIMSTVIQGHKGAFVGRIGEKGLKFSEGDGFKVLRKGSEIGSAVFEYGTLKFSIKAVKADDELFITSDARQLEELKTQNKRLPVNILFSARVGEPAELEFTCKNTTITIKSDFIVSAARSAPITAEDIKGQLEKLNDTFFQCGNIKIEIEGDIFLAKSQINEMRRRAAEKLKNGILSAYDK